VIYMNFSPRGGGLVAIECTHSFWSTLIIFYWAKKWAAYCWEKHKHDVSY